MAPASTAADDETRRPNAFGNDWTELFFAKRPVLAPILELLGIELAPNPPAMRAGGAGGPGRLGC